MPDARRRPRPSTHRVTAPAGAEGGRADARAGPAEVTLRRLRALGVLRTVGGRVRTTRRWQAAMARAAAGLQRAGAPWQDLRLPMAMALVELAPGLPDDELARCVEVLVPVEEGELGPLFAPEPGRPPAT